MAIGFAQGLYAIDAADGETGHELIVIVKPLHTHSLLLTFI